mmetsp:Transcript_13757/g.20968  ORF Transcript_13757/g.20968 Transcript_13757/m.20968 type:complete len:201 (+) Transcript_13757:90-692(+)
MIATAALSQRCLSDRETELNHLGGILYLELIELKEELCFEKQELDHLKKQRSEVQQARNDISEQINLYQQVKEADVRTTLHEIKGMRQRRDDLDEETEMLSSETEFIGTQNDELIQKIEKLLESEKVQDIFTTRAKDQKRQATSQKSSRYLRRQKRLMNQCSQNSCCSMDSWESLQESFQSLEFIDKNGTLHAKTSKKRK